MAIIRPYRGMTPQIGNNVYLADDVVIIGEVIIEDDVNIWWGSVLRGDCGLIRIGKGSNIQDGCMLHSTTDYSTTVLENDVSVGHHAVIHGARRRHPGSCDRRGIRSRDRSRGAAPLLCLPDKHLWIKGWGMSAC